MIEPKYLDAVVAVIESQGFQLVEDRRKHLKKWRLDRNECVFCKVFVNTTPLRVYATYISSTEAVRHPINADTVEELGDELSVFCSRFLPD